MLVLKKEKQKREKKPSKFKLWHQKMKSTSRGKAILKLIYWGIFFFILFLFLGITSMFTRDDVPMNSPVEQTPEEEKKPLEEEVLPTIQEMQEEVLTGHIRYTYDIQIGGYTYLFEGDRYDTYEEGYNEGKKTCISYPVTYPITYPTKSPYYPTPNTPYDPFYYKVTCNTNNTDNSTIATNTNGEQQI